MSDYSKSDLPPSQSGLESIQLFDRFGFLLAFVVGAFGILLLKGLEVQQGFVTLFAVAIMGVYAAVIYWSPRLRLREDQAGDNLYYLGLLFTLVSLAWALWVFSPEAGAKQVIESFGIALGTTIVGLSLRIFFNQMRDNPIEIEQEARWELAEAANRVRGSLDEVINDMNHFHRTITQSISEAHNEAAKLVGETAAEAIERLDSVSTSVSANITDAFKGLNRHSARLTKVAESIVLAMEKHAASLDQLAEGSKSLENQLGTLAKIATDAERGLNGLTKKTAEMRTVQAAMMEVAAASKGLIADQQLMLPELRSTLEAFCQKVTSVASAWEIEEGEALKRLVAKSSTTQQALDEEIRRLLFEQAQALQGFSETLELASSTATNHTEALARELENSRRYTSLVHQNLVDMTGELVNRLEKPQPVSVSETLES